MNIIIILKEIIINKQLIKNIDNDFYNKQKNLNKLKIN